MKYLNKINSPQDLKRLNKPALNYLCSEIRQFLLETIAETGGHLASNLGVVELTVALHYCFDSPRDKIIWDVGHQSYVHKLLTGRRDKFDSLRMQGGLSGFPKPEESPHDVFAAGHSSTSISAAAGLCLSRDLSGESYNVIPVIGDGSMTGGLAFEGMNNIGRMNSNCIIILNDNQMSISENVGAVSKRLNEIRMAPKYLEAKQDVNNFLQKVPLVGKGAARVIEKTKDTLKSILVPGKLFEEFGITYYGPIDGHNLEELISYFNQIKNINKPVLVHIYTKKGKGYNKAESAPAKFHGVDSFCLKTGIPVETKMWDTYSDVFGKTLVRLAEDNEKIVALVAAMISGTGLSAFAERYPERLFDVGIAEGHAVTCAAAMAKNGLIPVFAVYSTFLQRAYDQIVHDVCMQNLPVIFAVDRAGVVGSDGETHQGMFDISFLSHIPNLVIMAPKNKRELRKMLAFAVKLGRPVAIRYPRGYASVVLKGFDTELELAKSETVLEGEDCALISLGAMMDVAYEASMRLKERGFNPALINARFAKPVDESLVRMLGQYKYVYVFEDNVGTGGFASNLLSLAAAGGVKINNFYSFAFPDEYIAQGSREEVFLRYGMDAEAVENRIIEDLQDSY